MDRQPPSRRRGRPPLAWLTAEATAELPPGTAVKLEQTGRHNARVVGRVLAATRDCLSLITPYGPRDVPMRTLKRARRVEALYEPGDAVLRRHVSAQVWRGGVVRTEGTDVLVEQIDGSFDWFPEDALEPADARDPVLPFSSRGPVPARIA